QTWGSPTIVDSSCPSERRAGVPPQSAKPAPAVQRRDTAHDEIEHIYSAAVRGKSCAVGTGEGPAAARDDHRHVYCPLLRHAQRLERREDSRRVIAEALGHGAEHIGLRHLFEALAA